MVEILGVKIDDKTGRDFLKIIEERLLGGKKTFIATPNPEMLILAHRNKDFKDVLNKTDLNIPDGYGLRLGAKILGQKLDNRATGTDLMVALCGLAEKEGRGIYLLGGRAGIARRAAEKLREKYKNLKVCGAEHGSTEDMGHWDNRVITEHINAVAPDILFVALGHGKQERWIAEHFKKMPSVEVAMGVGGAFDFVSGKIRRAPKWMRSVGLEWLWRLCVEPKRWKRIIGAVIVFPWLCLKNKNQRVYR